MAKSSPNSLFIFSVFYVSLSIQVLSDNFHLSIFVAWEGTGIHKHTALHILSLSTILCSFLLNKYLLYFFFIIKTWYFNIPRGLEIETPSICKIINSYYHSMRRVHQDQEIVWISSLLFNEINRPTLIAQQLTTSKQEEEVI